MTARRLAAPVLYVDRPVIGTEVEVANVLRNLRGRGQLVASTPARPVGTGDPRVQLIVRILPTPPQPVAAPWYRTPRGIAGIVATVLVILAGLGYLAFLLVQAVIAALPLLLTVLFLTALVGAGLRRVGVCCPGLHCSGCGCRR